MKFSEYQTQIDRLIKVYGQNKYPQERIEMIFKRIGAVDVETFKNQVSFFIGSSDKPPFQQEFVDALGSILVDAKKREIEAKLKLIPPCPVCFDAGNVAMYEKANGCDFAFQCNCERGKLLYPSLPKQFEGMGEIYASHRAWAAGKFNRIEAVKNARHVIKT